jgi:hypothetical protein
MSDQLELVLRIFFLVEVGVQLPCKLAVSLFDLILGCISRESQNLIMVAQEFSSSTWLRYLATALTDAMFPE